MGDLMKGLLGRIVMGAIGLVAALAWFSWSGGGGDFKEMSRMPDSVFGGGGGKVTVEFESSHPAVLKATFEQWDEEGEESETIYVNQNVQPGWSARSIDLAEGTYVYFELGVPEPEVGATLDMTVLLNGQKVYTQKDKLERALEGNYAFFLNFEAEDVEQMRRWRDEG